MGPVARPLAERFAEKIRSGPQCPTEWAARTNRHRGAYGLMWVPAVIRSPGRQRLAQHVAWFLAYGEWPAPGLCVCHRCDNPSCVTVEHLFLGTHADNVADKMAKGRQPRGQAHGMSKLTEDDVRAIRLAYAAGETQSSLTVRFGVTSGTVSMICTRRRWAHVKENA